MVSLLYRSITGAFLLLALSCRASAQDVQFNRVVLPEENITGLVVGITQDLQGNMWFACRGLHRYDGVHLKTFVYDPLNPASLATNTVECVYTDRAGNIWAGTYGGGLDKFDPKTERFTHYKHEKNDPASISNDSVTCILEDHEGFMWIGTEHGGLNRMDPRSGKFVRYRHAENDPTSLSFDMVRAIYEDHNSVIWVGTGSPFLGPTENPLHKGGLNRFNKHNGTFTRYLHDAGNSRSLADDRVRAIFEDSKGNFWVGTAGDGLHTMDRLNGTFERHSFEPAHPEKLSRPPLKKLYPWGDDHITFITEDARGAIWIGTFGNGISRYDPSSKTLTRYARGKESPGRFADSTSWWVFKSRDDVMWISTWEGALYRLDPSHENFSHQSIGNQMVFAFTEQDPHTMLFGTDSGIVRWDREANKVEVFTHDSSRNESISDNFVFVLYKDRGGRLWAGTEGDHGGLNLFDPEKKRFTSYRHNAGSSSSLSHNVVISLYEDAESNFWVGTIAGLDRMDRATGAFVHYRPYPADSLPGGKNLVSCMVEDSQHKLWVGTANEGGLHLLDRNTGKFTHYLTRHSVLSLLEDGFGKVWVGAEDGLYLYNRERDSFALYIDPSTGNNFYAVGIVEDNHKNLWITSGAGIFCINSKRDEVTRFSKGFGVDPSGLLGIRPYKGSDGQVFFGSIGGYYAIHPERINSHAKPPEIILTDFKIGDQIVRPGGGELKEDLSGAKEVRLKHNQNVFSLLFSVVHYGNPDGNKAMYRLDNYDQNWRRAGSERIAYYYNIPPGEYTLRIKAASAQGVWAEKSINIVITPPWWKRWWAFCIYAVLAVLIGYWLHQLQKRTVIRAERERTRERELKQAKEIEKAYLELKQTQTQLIQSEKMASLGELTAGIAHEIQNPLNFVNNFSEINVELIDEMQAEMSNGNYADAKTISDDIRENEQKINHHGKRADSIVKGMLQHSRTSNGIKEPTNINALADEYLRLAYHGLRARDKNFNAILQTNFDPSIPPIALVPQDIGRVLLNLFNNAFYALADKKKQATPGFEPTISVSTSIADGQLEFSVKDNGNGIPEHIRDRIFQPFFTTKPTGEGTGLGLSLSYDIIKAHGGEIKLSSEEGSGSEFLVLLPLA